MNVFGFAVGIFGKRLGSQELKQVESNGQSDGEAAADAYCTGFVDGAHSVFERRMREF